MRNITCKQLSDELNLSYPVAAGLMKLLEAQGQAKLVAKVFHKSQKGKPTRVYTVPNQAKIKIPEVKPAPKYRLIGSKIVQTTDIRSKHTPKKKFKKVA